MLAAVNKQNIEIKPNNVLSDIGKAFTAIAHTRPLTHLPTTFGPWSTLDVVGVEAETKAAILVQYTMSEWFSATLLQMLISPITFIPCNPATSLLRRESCESSQSVLFPSPLVVLAPTTVSRASFNPSKEDLVGKEGRRQERRRRTLHARWRASCHSERQSLLPNTMMLSFAVT